MRCYGNVLHSNERLQISTVADRLLMFATCGRISWKASTLATCPASLAFLYLIILMIYEVIPCVPRGNAVDLYSGGYQFESRTEHQKSFDEISCAVLSSLSRQTTRQCLTTLMLLSKSPVTHFECFPILDAFVKCDVGTAMYKGP
jgi:hypothetical protein